MTVGRICRRALRCRHESKRSLLLSPDVPTAAEDDRDTARRIPTYTGPEDLQVPSAVEGAAQVHVARTPGPVLPSGGA